MLIEPLVGIPLAVLPPVAGAFLAWVSGGGGGKMGKKKRAKVALLLVILWCFLEILLEMED